MELKFHHVGEVVSSIKDKYKFYQSLGFAVSSDFKKAKVDKNQRVIVGAVRKGNLLIELLEPFSADSPIANFQKKRGGLHHICYKVDCLDKAIKEIKEKSLAKQITQATVSAWNNRRVVFFLNSDRGIFELID